jgi:hypothetical protein
VRDTQPFRRGTKPLPAAPSPKTGLCCLAPISTNWYGTSTVTPGSHSLLERGTGEWPADLRTSHAAWQDGLRR